MFRAVHEGRIRFLWVMGTNPAVSMPNASFVREALARCETLVVSEVIAETDTARLADIRLPALAWGEKDGTVTNSERTVSRQRPLFAVPGEARADWRIVAEVAARLGHGARFAWQRPAEVFGEHAAMTGLAARHGKLLDLTAWADCSAAEYEAMRPFQWGGPHPLAGRFPTADGKARLVAVAPPAGPAASDRFPLRLNTGRYRDQWHTMTRTGLSPRLSIHRREPLLEVHADDAAAAGLEDGRLARIATAHGESVFRVAISPGQRRGEAFVPMHWTDAMSSGGRTGRLVHDARDPHSGQPAFKNVPAAIAPVASDWRAFLVSRRPVEPAAGHWTRARIAGGWLHEIEGAGAVAFDGLLPPGTRSEVADGKRGMRRICVTDAAGMLVAALYLTRQGKLPAREWVERQFAAPGASPLELLAGRPAVPLPDRGPLVCLCFDVGEREIGAAAAAGACSVEAVGGATRAGTNCGSCRPLIARLLDGAVMEPAACSPPARCGWSVPAPAIPSC
jgi:assimilatory nitrate reductase catalytic subunit